MSDQNPDDIQKQWAAMMENFNDAVAESMEQNVQVQADFMEAWAEALEDSVPDENAKQEGMEGYARAYEVWMDATEEMYERGTDMASGEGVDVTEFRDIWLRSANEAFKEVMRTSAFAAANGQLVEVMMNIREQADDISEDTIAQLGFPTQSDVEEVGERLLELERRQHSVEEKLDRILDHVEE